MPPEGAFRASAGADPVLTANVYCAGGLDEVIRRALLPSWREWERQSPDTCYLWFVRYRRCGEHLKVRLHAPAAQRTAAQRLFERSVANCFAEFGPAPPSAAAPAAGPKAPAIDIEDEAEVDYPDRTLLWTRYRRSHVSLGGKPFLDDDDYAARLTACLGQACELVLAAAEAAPLSHRLRQNTLLRALIAGLAALGLDAPQRSDYLIYHRDWLLRFTLVRNQVEAEKAREFLDVFDRRAAGTTIEQLARMAEAQWRGDGDKAAPWEASRWQRALSELVRHLALFRGDPEYCTDPFATDPAFPPVFKVFHGLANQLGLNMVDEAFAHHLLLRATSGESRDPLQVALTAESLG